MDEEQYVKRMRGGATPDILDDFARQCHRNAEIATEKYRLVQKACVLMAIAWPIWVIAIGVMAYASTNS